MDSDYAAGVSPITRSVRFRSYLNPQQIGTYGGNRVKRILDMGVIGSHVAVEKHLEEVDSGVLVSLCGVVPSLLISTV
ncbi:MAG: hypothetical protein ACFCU2_05530 [Acidimicrobiia bacterium]